MPNYKETLVEGQKYTRTSSIVIQNQLGQSPTVEWYEEDIITINNQQIRLNKGSFTTVLNPNDVIDIINPYTNQPVGQTITAGEIYAMLYSAYWKYAQIRDNTLPEPEPII